MKKLTLLILCCILIFSLFACGSSNSQQQDENNPDADKEIVGSQDQPDTPDEEDTENSDTNGQPDTPNEEDAENSDTNTPTPNIKASEGLKYALSDDGTYYMVVSIGECTDIDIIIPSEYKDLPVTVIAEGAFAFKKDIASITIPKSIATIESSVFYRCTSLLSINVEKSNTNFSSINGNLYSKDGKKLIQYAVGKSETLFKIPDGVTDILTYAFRDCDGLTGIIIPTSLTQINSRAFAQCDNIAQIFYEGTSRDWNGISISKEGNDVLKSAKRYYYFEDIPPRINYYWHYENGTATIWNEYKDYPYSIGLYYDKNPDGESYCVTGVGDCSDLRIIIPNEYNGLPVTKIADSVFENQYKIKSVTVPENVVTIGKNAFRNCHALGTVYLSENLSSIGSYAFSYCNSLLSINVDEKNEYYCSIDGNLYTKDKKTLIKYASGKKDYDFIIPDTVAYVGKHAFNKCMYLVNITIPDSVVTIENGAFSECRKITSVILPNSISMIDESMFYNCPALTSVTIGNGVTSIGEDAFYGCSSLTSVTFGENNQLTSIGDRAFADCSSLTSITIPDSVTSIGERAFYDCDSLTSVTFGENSQLTSIGYEAFRNCASLTSITIPDSVTSIGDWAFYNCDSLTSITVPSCVTSIGDMAFYSCYSLTSVYYTGTVSEWGNIFIGSANSALTNATRYYYSETEPTVSGNYWHYVDGEIVIW